jgi:homoserine dehydrogenase
VSSAATQPPRGTRLPGPPTSRRAATLRAREAPGDGRRTATPVRVALLGLGTVGSAVARLATRVSLDGRDIHLTGALVRDNARAREAAGVPVTTDVDAIVAARPDIAIEALGGAEPARTIVLECLRRGVHVVTANKSLIAAHGDELRAVARASGAALRDEATVIAGVPFLATLARRPLACEVTSVTGILNGTTHFLLSAIERGETFAGALAEARRLGLAESDPSSDVDGIDASEKLAILVRLLGRLRLSPASVARRSIADVTPHDLQHAAILGGTLKPVAHAAWSGPTVHAFVGPAFVPASHPLASISGVTNGIVLTSASGPLFYGGPGAGPEITARTLLDDVAEVARGERLPWPEDGTAAEAAASPQVSWLLRISSPAPLPGGSDLADLLASHGVFVRRGSESSDPGAGESRWLLTWPVVKVRVDAALDAVRGATGCAATAFRSVEDTHAL